MANIRRRKHAQGQRVTPAAVEAFNAGDRMALARELRLPPWQISPIDADADCPYPPSTMAARMWPESLALRAELIA